MNETKVGDTGKTRDGRPYRVVCLDAKGDDDYSVIALVASPDGRERVCAYQQNGRYLTTEEHPFDLLREPKKMTLWFNLLRNSEGRVVAGIGFTTEAQARAAAHPLAITLPATFTLDEG